MVSKRQLSALLPEGKRAIKRQLYSELLTLREAASSILCRAITIGYRKFQGCESYARFNFACATLKLEYQMLRLLVAWPMVSCQKNCQ